MTLKFHLAHKHCHIPLHQLAWYQVEQVQIVCVESWKTQASTGTAAINSTFSQPVVVQRKDLINSWLKV